MLSIDCTTWQPLPKLTTEINPHERTTEDIDRHNIGEAFCDQHSGHQVGDPCHAVGSDESATPFGEKQANFSESQRTALAVVQHSRHAEVVRVRHCKRPPPCAERA